MNRNHVKIDRNYGIAQYKDYKFVALDLDTENETEIEGCLFKNGNRLCTCGYWRTNDIVEALEKAIKYHKAGLLSL